MIGKKLKLLRESKQLTQSKMADLLQLNRVTCNRYENDEREPDYKTLKKLADFFGVTTDYLLGRETLIKTDTIISHEDLELLNQIKQASQDKQKAIELILGIKEQAALVSSDK